MEGGDWMCVSLAWADGGVVKGWERARVKGEDDEGRKVR